KQGVGAAVDVQTVLADERARIRGIRDIIPAGYEALADKLMFDEPVSVEAAALAIVRAQRARQEQRARDREEEAPKPLPSAPAAVSGEQGMSPYEAATDAAVAQINAKRRGQTREGDEQQPGE